ncbi:MAG TPA: hypothetical protein VMR76_02040 [Candidatus Saccharimonadia bacterium]|jgi:hypothetical protein|nr:hypothetical protein [Candidatus Saccharimonadia bacterium]
MIPDNPFERTTHDPRHIGVATWALKRGRNGEGPAPLEVVVENMGAVAVFGADERKRIVDVVSSVSGPSAVEAVGNEIAEILVEKLREQRQNQT